MNKAKRLQGIQFSPQDLFSTHGEILSNSQEVIKALFLTLSWPPKESQLLVMVRKIQSEEKSDGPQLDNRLIQDLKGSLNVYTSQNKYCQLITRVLSKFLEISMGYCI